MKKRLLVLGATGFIGRNMAEHFANKAGYEVLGTYHKSTPLDHPGIEMIKADLTRAEDVDRVMEGVDIVIQAAATTSGAKDIVSKPYIHVTDNAVMNSLIARAAFDHSIKHVIVFSCSVMYQSSNTPLRESDFNPNDEMHKNYFGAGWMKVFVEKMGEFYARLGRNRYTLFRHSNIYGPYDKYDLEKSHVFGATVTKVMTADDGRILVWGAGEEERDLLYVDDLVHAVELAIDKQDTAYELMNIGYGSSISINDLVKKIIDVSGRDVKMEFDLSKPTIKTRLCLDSSLAGAKLGWKPSVSLDEGIERTIEWYRRNLL
jgi:GDP-L-fucose synthase